MALNSSQISFSDADLAAYVPQRLRIVWLENTLDCRTWTYYCDIKQAMERLHEVCVPLRSRTCTDGRRGFRPQVIVAGPRYMANIAHADETLGLDRNRFAHLPLAVMQNKMYTASTREIVGDVQAKLNWARAAGASVAFTWLPTQHRDFTARSGILHHRLPFGVDEKLYGRHAASLQQADAPPQEFDIGFTGASSHKYPLREAILRLVRSLPVRSYLGTWQQTSLHRSDNHSWKALGRDGYVQQIARTKMWVSTTGPSNIVGTRYFEILASGTTLLLCNRAPAGVYDGLFEDGKHAVLFDGMEDLKRKVLYYHANESARRRIVVAAAALVRRIHTWDARARFMTRAIEQAMRQHDPQLPFYTRPTDLAVSPDTYVGCIDYWRAGTTFTELSARRPLRRFTVESCGLACRRQSRTATHFAVHCGGFCSGNGHKLARCLCAKGTYASATTQAGGDSGATAMIAGPRHPKAECATTCSLHDARPCGGHDAVAVYHMVGPGRNRGVLRNLSSLILAASGKQPQTLASGRLSKAMPRASSSRIRSRRPQPLLHSKARAAGQSGVGE